MSDPNLWSHRNEPEIIWYMDPDKVAHFFATIVEHERETQTFIIDSIFDLFDPDTCPVKYLAYLGDMVGVKVDSRDREETWRAQIRSAVAWYKEKGKITSFTILFRTMGLNVEVYPLWINEQGKVEREPVDSSWKPHARIDLVIREYPEWQRYFPDNLQYVLHRMEDVRPIHVLLRGIFLGWDLFDAFPFEDITEISENRILGQFEDDFISVYYGTCSIWHFPTPRGIYRDGGGYNWLEATKGIVTAPPVSPDVGDRYVVAHLGTTGIFIGHENEIAEWTGVFWAYFVPADDDALWVKSGAVPIEPIAYPGDWKSYFFNGVTWQYTWKLFQTRYAPGPFFRECKGSWPCPDVPMICDNLETIISWSPDSDPYSYCMYHDASVIGIPPHPIHGGIQLRDGSRRHNCGEVGDIMDWTISGAIFTDTFPNMNDSSDFFLTMGLSDSVSVPRLWDTGLLWDTLGLRWDDNNIAVDYLEIWITDHVGGGPAYKYTGNISGQ